MQRKGEREEGKTGGRRLRRKGKDGGRTAVVFFFFFLLKCPINGSNARKGRCKADLQLGSKVVPVFARPHCLFAGLMGLSLGQCQRLAVLPLGLCSLSFPSISMSKTTVRENKEHRRVK
jgi:hypothetical protein